MLSAHNDAIFVMNWDGHLGGVHMKIEVEVERIKAMNVHPVPALLFQVHIDGRRRSRVSVILADDRIVLSIPDNKPDVIRGIRAVCGRHLRGNQV